jgi:hypothetical protein
VIVIGIDWFITVIILEDVFPVLFEEIVLTLFADLANEDTITIIDGIWNVSASTLAFVIVLVHVSF